MSDQQDEPHFVTCRCQHCDKGIEFDANELKKGETRVPADENHETQLHDFFESKNLRGEWFTLTPDDVMWVISYLKRQVTLNVCP